MQTWYWFAYYPCSIILSGAMGYGLGYFINTLIRFFHRRTGSVPPFAPGFESPVRWGIFFGVCIGLSAAIMQLVVPYSFAR